jgi:uncharacterized protein (TIGR02391 family)
MGNAETKLTLSMTKATKLIDKRIKKGNDFLERSILSSNEFKKLKKDYNKWNNYNRDLLIKIFTDDSIKNEYNGFCIGVVGSHRDSIAQKIKRKKDNIEEKINALESIKERLELYDVSEENNEKSKSDFWILLHPKVVKIAQSRFKAGHFADSVEAAIKEFNSHMKRIVQKNGGEEYDGADLMHRALSPDNPILKLDNLNTESGRNIQQGYMQMFAGAMIGIRNPKAHGNLVINRKRAIHFLFLISLFFYKIEERI